MKSESKEVMMQPYAVKNDRNCSKLSEHGEERRPCSGGTQRTWLASLSAADPTPTPHPHVSYLQTGGDLLEHSSETNALT